ncbi:uncharacterized protein [Leptinotarsa decemlineata]|uniref:uncharacterized protein n=1 Tax=Leptinotarsa decemlineata TaxID=7539 RepID=UPI003D305880
MIFNVFKGKCFLLTILGILSGITALKDVTVTIPLAARIMDTVELQCQYDLEGEPLYTVKWYKGSKEFYRYIPKELPNIQVFPLPGISIDLNKSSATLVVLKNMQLEGTGRYKCEVSSDAPNFYTQMQSGYMYVIDVPERDPVLTIEKETLGYALKGNCTAPPSYPPVNLTWFLNGRQVKDFSRGAHPTDRLLFKNRRIPIVSSSIVELELDSNIFQSGRAVLACHGTVFNLYERKKEVILEEERPQPRPSSVLGTLDSTSDTGIIVFGMISFPLLLSCHVILR